MSDKKTMPQMPPISEAEKAHHEIALKTALEGMVLLENDGTLPLKETSKVALYGEGARHTVPFAEGIFSVSCRNPVSVEEGLKSEGFEITTEDWLDAFDLSRTGDGKRKLLPDIQRTKDTDTAIVVLSRMPKQGEDRRYEKGDYFLTDEESAMVFQVARLYPKTIILLNVCGLIDLSFLDKNPISSVLLMGLAGQAGGEAAARLIRGTNTPSGKLTDTWAFHYEDYPAAESFLHNPEHPYRERYREGIYVGYRYFRSFGIPARYDFGYGLSYTTFSWRVRHVENKEGNIRLHITIKNTGTETGKEVLQIYVSKPWGLRKKELIQLVAFHKTKELAPGEEERLTIHFPIFRLASYHAGQSKYFFDRGDYIVLLGNGMDHLDPAALLHVSRTLYLNKMKSILHLHDALKEIEPPENVYMTARAAWLKHSSILPIIEIKDPRLVHHSEETLEWIDWDDLPGDEVSAAPFALRRMTLRDKVHLVVGHHPTQNQINSGEEHEPVPGAMGQTTTILAQRLRIPSAIIAGSSQGLNLKKYYTAGGKDQWQITTAIPDGTVLAQTFDRELLKRTGEMIAEEMKYFHVRLWLAPGMNIHRNMLCGSNAFSFSEDPLLSGLMAAALTDGVQEDRSIGIVINSFACQNQEDNRRDVSSVVSERALREIYLKGFEICVQHSQPKAIMTSYNKINGIHAANSTDLCTEVARNEWGFEGFFMTPWAATNENGGSSAAKCIDSGCDLILPGGDSDRKEIRQALQGTGDFSLRLEDLNQSALRILTFILTR